MNEQTRPPSVRLYCTAGNGMEHFLLQEVKDKLAAEEVDHIPGKVFFSCSAGVKRVRELKAAERLFLLLRRDKPLPASATASQIQSALIGDGRDWIVAVETWRALRRELTSGGAGRKRKREEDEEEEEESAGKTTTDGPMRTQRLSPDGETRKLGSCDAPSVSSSGRNCSGEGDVAEDTFKGDTFKADHGRTSGRVTRDRSGPLTPDPATYDPVTFRVSCRCSGVVSRHFGAQDLSRILGTGLSRRLDWRVDLKKPELEVNVYLSDDHCVLGIPLLSLPLANRSYIQTHGMRSTIAWAMASLANIQPGSRVVDPMCGVGTILLEAAQEHQACFLGVDVDEAQLCRARGNVEFAALTHRVQLLRASAAELPLLSGSVDALVCDLPFGKKFGTRSDMAASLPGLLAEMERVLRVGGTMVLLLSPQLSSVLKRALTGPPADPGPPAPAPGEELPAGLDRPAVTPLRPSGPMTSLRSGVKHRVSLGAIDGLIHQYVKIQPAS